jgi:hypothetical protein
MATVNLSIPADLMKAARSKLGGGGQTHVKQYLLSSLQSLADDRMRLDREGIRALVEGAQSPQISGGDAYWAAKVRAYKKRNTRHAKRGRA